MSLVSRERTRSPRLLFPAGHRPRETTRRGKEGSKADLPTGEGPQSVPRGESRGEQEWSGKFA